MRKRACTVLPGVLSDVHQGELQLQLLPARSEWSTESFVLLARPRCLQQTVQCVTTVYDTYCVTGIFPLWLTLLISAPMTDVTIGSRLTFTTSHNAWCCSLLLLLPIIPLSCRCTERQIRQRDPAGGAREPAAGHPVRGRRRGAREHEGRAEEQPARRRQRRVHGARPPLTDPGHQQHQRSVMLAPDPVRTLQCSWASSLL